VPETASQIRDPKGMLLTPAQRIDRARSFLGTALALALVNGGWKVHTSPGEFYLDRNGEQLNPHKVIVQLSDGAISKEEWGTKCKALGIEDLSLIAIPEKTETLPQTPTNS